MGFQAAPEVEYDSLALADVQAADQPLVLLSWDSCRFVRVAQIQEAARNNGVVELAEDRLTGRLVAVKAMPYSWTCTSHEEFVAAHPEGTEHCCVLSYCAGGDLFSWLERSLQASDLARESTSRALVGKVIGAVHDIHSLGVSHGDLSLENILLAEAGSCDVIGQICIIDFGASMIGSQVSGVRGKPSYQAPEMHSGRPYNAAAADVFALGVVAFTLIVGNYPWRSTRPMLCPRFRYFAEKGLTAYLRRQKVNRDGAVMTLASMIS